MRQCLILGHCFSAASATVFVAITFPLWQPSSQHAQSLARWQSNSAEKRVRTTLLIAPMRAQGSTHALAEGRAARLEREHLVAARRPACATNPYVPNPHLHCESSRRGLTQLTILCKKSTAIPEAGMYTSLPGVLDAL
ncbi:hypothetical protein B0H14DRAFT_3464687 [Mycena olivaceomarginata]|nr:hypothetical protein B0H14DRAFT_3485209 [Mycena olivaceomarginata]KAJ7830548.1 hypothetical protein B0H14DRAFT_3464687 [Mycena olivaceomarginata]